MNAPCSCSSGITRTSTQVLSQLGLDVCKPWTHYHDTDEATHCPGVPSRKDDWAARPQPVVRHHSRDGRHDFLRHIGL